MPPHRFAIHRNVENAVPAAGGLEGIKHYQQHHSAHFAEVRVRTAYRRIRSLRTSPDRGRPGHRAGTREPALTPTAQLSAAFG